MILWLIWCTKGVLLWVLIAAFLATALNPAVDWLAHGVGRRGGAVAIVYLAPLG